MVNLGCRADRREAMRALLAKWERSGLSLARFAQREGVAVKTLYRWRRRLGVGVRRGDRAGRRRSRGAARPARPALGPAPMFTEVTATLGRLSAAAMFEVQLSDGTTVRMPEDFDPDSLRILLAALREC